ncbi:polysaccharide biosynthesis tyrosine autokinase [Chloroflexota bacterium]
MTMRDYLEILLRRKWVVIITLAVVMAIAVIVTLLATPKYQASTMMRVLAVTGGSSDWVSYDTKQIDRLMNTYAEFATSRPVLNELVQSLGLQGRPAEERPQIEVEIVLGTELIQITAEALDPIVAKDAANTLVDILIHQSRALYIGSGKSAQEILGEQLAQVKAELDQAWTEYEAQIAQAPEDSDRIAAAGRTIELKETTYAQLLEQYERNRVREAVLANTLSVVEPAVEPSEPSKPRKQLNLALGFVVGLAGGVALAFLIESLDTTLYATEQIKKLTELPILGQVPSAGRQDQPVLFNGTSPQGEAFRRLRTNLFSLDHDSSLQTLLVTSAEPREGKSTIVGNLAFAVAQSGRKVIVVDAHLRLPTLHKIFDLSNRVGLSTVLEQKATLDGAVQKAEIPGVHVLTSGPLPVNPAELISSPQMSDLVRQLAQQFDMILLDTPSLLAVTDAAAVSQTVNGVVLVVERGHARQESVRAAREQMADVKVSPVGVIVNRSKQNGIYDYYERMPT